MQLSLFVLSLQYSEKALYNQLCFYSYIFDWDYAVAKVLQPHEKSKTMQISCRPILTPVFVVDLLVFVPSFLQFCLNGFGAEIKLEEPLRNFGF